MFKVVLFSMSYICLIVDISFSYTNKQINQFSDLLKCRNYQNDNGSAPVFSIPRSLIAENPFTSLLLCSYSPSRFISSVQPDLSWCQQLSIEVMNYFLSL